MCVTNISKRRTAPISKNNGSVTTAPSLISQRLMGNFMPLMMENTTISKPVPSGTASTESQVGQAAQMHQHDIPNSLFQTPNCSLGSQLFEEKRRPKRRRKPQKPGKTAKHNDRHFVVHNYHDHALDPDENDYAHEEDNGSKRRGGVSLSFPAKLHRILDQVEVDGLGHVISWQPHGRCFVIHKPKEFIEHVMPQYFRQSKLTSFQRQLNLYGFCRLTRGTDSGGYYHELFLRGKAFLTKTMQRTKIKGTKFKAASSPDQEPDFYSMPPVGPSFSQAPVVSDDSSADESHFASGMMGVFGRSAGDSMQPLTDPVYDPLPANIQRNALIPYPLTGSGFMSNNQMLNVLAGPSMNPGNLARRVEADKILDEAVIELFRETKNSDVVDDSNNFEDIWDGAEFGEETYQDDLQLGFMLERLLDE